MILQKLMNNFISIRVLKYDVTERIQDKFQHYDYVIGVLNFSLIKVSDFIQIRWYISLNLWHFKKWSIEKNVFYRFTLQSKVLT